MTRLSQKELLESYGLSFVLALTEKLRISGRTLADKIASIAWRISQCLAALDVGPDTPPQAHDRISATQVPDEEVTEQIIAALAARRSARSKEPWRVCHD